MPSPAGPNGRDTKGRFTPGNSIGRGNPYAKRVQRLRAALLEAVTEQDIQDIVATLVSAAKNGDTVAAREVLDRTIGKSVQTDMLQRVEQLEKLIGEPGS